MNIPSTTLRQFLSACVIATLAMGGSGCAQLGLAAMFKKDRIIRADAKTPVDEIVNIWEIGEGRGLDGMPTRGFAGQIMFFSAGINEPIAGNGDIRVYVFDDLGTADEQTRPLHQFDFPAVAWNAFLREANIGPGYQIFIPYTRKGGQQAECSLRIRYTPADGGLPVYSKMVSVILPGTKPVDSELKRPSERQATTASQQFPGAIPKAADHGVLTLDGLGSRPDLRTDRLENAAQELAATLNPNPQFTQNTTLDSGNLEPRRLDAEAFGTIRNSAAQSTLRTIENEDSLEEASAPRRYRLQ